MAALRYLKAPEKREKQRDSHDSIQTQHSHSRGEMPGDGAVRTGLERLQRTASCHRHTPRFLCVERTTRSGDPARAGGCAAQIAHPDHHPTPPHAASGFDSQRIIYVRTDHQLEYFSHSEWVDPPARMLGPLMATAIEHTGAFAAVVVTPASAAGDQRLDTEIVRLQHNFQTRPSRVQFTLRATLVDDKSRRVLASQEFSDEVAAISDSPHGGVTAANEVVQRVLDKLAQFVAHAHDTKC